MQLFDPSLGERVPPDDYRAASELVRLADAAADAAAGEDRVRLVDVARRVWVEQRPVLAAYQKKLGVAWKSKEVAGRAFDAGEVAQADMLNAGNDAELLAAARRWCCCWREESGARDAGWLIEKVSHTLLAGDRLHLGTGGRGVGG